MIDRKLRRDDLIGKKCTPTYVESIIQHLQIDVAEWAGKLEMMRSLLYGEDLNWEHIQQQLELHDKDGGSDSE